MNYIYILKLTDEYGDTIWEREYETLEEAEDAKYNLSLCIEEEAYED